MPTCDAGDTQIAGACAADLSCYTRTACGTSINCRKTATVDAGTTPCDPTKEPYRNDVATAPAKCAVIDYAFPPNTNGFENACGRGCQRDPACPVSVNCQPGPGSRDPLCSDGTKCPYTIRAL